MSLSLIDRFLLSIIFQVMRTFPNVYWKYDVKSYWWRHMRNCWRYYLLRKNKRKYLPIFTKNSENIYLSIGRCLIVFFSENRISINVQNVGPKFGKQAYSFGSIVLQFEMKIYICNLYDRLIFGTMHSSNVFLRMLLV